MTGKAKFGELYGTWGPPSRQLPVQRFLRRQETKRKQEKRQAASCFPLEQLALDGKGRLASAHYDFPKPS